MEVSIPPVGLTARLAQCPARWGDQQGYLNRGMQSRQAIERVLPDYWGWAGRSVLDFGCGAGRTIRHLTNEAPECELWGSDISASCIAWDNKHLSPQASFVHNDEVPPLPFEAGKFDLVYALSVFTHISQHWAGWLLEIHRVLAPNGLFVATFMGEAMCESVAGEPWDEDHVGMNVYESGQCWELGGPMVLHSPWWIREHWGRLFAIETLQSRGFMSGKALSDQDDHGVVVVRKTDKRATVEELERLDPSERREATALYHDLQHLRVEVAALRAKGNAGGSQSG